MTKTTTRRIALVPIALLFTATAYVVVHLLAMLFGLAVAHADTGESPDVPSFLAKYGWWGGGLLAYIAVRSFLKRNETEMWIARGRTLAVLTAVVSVVGSVVGWRFGMNPETVGIAVAGAVPLVVSPTVVPTVPTVVPPGPPTSSSPAVVGEEPRTPQ